MAETLDLSLPKSEDEKNLLILLADFKLNTRDRLHFLLETLNRKKHAEYIKQIQAFIAELDQLMSIEKYEAWFNKVQAFISSLTKPQYVTENTVIKSLFNILYNLNNIILTNQNADNKAWENKTVSLDTLLHENIKKNLKDTDINKPIFRRSNLGITWQEYINNVNDKLTAINQDNETSNKVIEKQIKIHQDNLITVSSWYNCKPDATSSSIKNAAISAAFNSHIASDFRKYSKEKNNKNENIFIKIYDKTIGQFFYENRNNIASIDGRITCADRIIETINKTKTHEDYLKLLEHLTFEINNFKTEKYTRLKGIIISKRQSVLSLINNTECSKDIKRKANDIINKSLIDRFSGLLTSFAKTQRKSIPYKIRKNLFDNTTKEDKNEEIINDLIAFLNKIKSFQEFTIDMVIDFIENASDALNIISNKDSSLYQLIKSQTVIIANKLIDEDTLVTSSNIRLDQALMSLPSDVKNLIRHEYVSVSNEAMKTKALAEYSKRQTQKKHGALIRAQERLEKLKEAKHEYFKDFVYNKVLSQIKGDQIIGSSHIQKTKNEDLYQAANIVGMAGPALATMAVPYATPLTKVLSAIITNQADQQNARHLKNANDFALKIEDAQQFAKILTEYLANTYTYQINLIKFSAYDTEDMNNFINTMLYSIFNYIENNPIPEFKTFEELANHLIVDGIMLHQCNLPRKTVMLEGLQKDYRDARDVLLRPAIMALNANNEAEVNQKNPSGTSLIINNASTPDYAYASIRLDTAQQQRLGRIISDDIFHRYEKNSINKPVKKKPQKHQAKNMSYFSNKEPVALGSADNNMTDHSRKMSNDKAQTFK